VLKKKNKRPGWLPALMRSDVGRGEERRSTQQQWLIDVANIMYEMGRLTHLNALPASCTTGLHRPARNIQVLIDLSM
jgi:hypothetical protein